MALQAGEREVNLSSRGRAYTIDFTAMQQIDDDTGSPSKVLRQECDVVRGEPCKLFFSGFITSVVFDALLCFTVFPHAELSEIII